MKVSNMDGPRFEHRSAAADLVPRIGWVFDGLLIQAIGP